MAESMSRLIVGWEEYSEVALYNDCVENGHVDWSVRRVLGREWEKSFGESERPADDS